MIDTRIFRLMADLRASYWFVPSVMALLAILLGAIMVWLDSGPAAGLLDGLGWYQKAKPDGAHQVLSTIAGSMITVAGVVFSITIVAIAYSASQYGPRILTNFMSDRGNQVTLGTFIATFAYCLVVLRTIRGGDEGVFVPQLAVMVGLLLALCSIAVLIYFIHHVPSSIHINNVVARIGKQLLHSVDKHFPSRVGDPVEGSEDKTVGSTLDASALKAKDAIPIGAPANGYIEALDDDTVMEVACSKNIVIKLHHRPGDFVLSGKALMSVWADEAIDDETKESLQASFAIGTHRTPGQDLFFLVDELVEIAARALSSGVNDPYTAMTCLDWLAASTAELCRRDFPSPCRADDQGDLRVIAEPHSFAKFVERGFGRMLPYLARDMNAATHAMSKLAEVGAECGKMKDRQSLRDQSDTLLRQVEQELVGPSLINVQRCHAALPDLA